MRLADDFYLVCHDDRTGDLTTSARLAGLGLAAGLVGELVLSGHLSLYGGGLYPIAAPEAPQDRLGREVLALVADGRHDRGLAGWLRFLAAEALVDVRRRLVAEGVLVRVRARRLLGGGRWSYPPASSNTAAWPGIRLARMLTDADPLTLQDAVLVGLIQATGLLGRVLWDGDQHAPGWASAARVREGLPSGLAVLVAHTATAAADAVLTQ